MNMGYLSKEQVSQVGKALSERRARLRAEISQGLVRAADDRYRNLAGMVADTADDAVADLVADIDIAEVSRDAQELREVDAALGRLHSAQFGACVDCGEPIGFERLKAQPSAARCVTCQVRHERDHARNKTSSL